MATVALTRDNFEAVVGKQGIVVIDFWADWCGPCRAFAPVFDALAERNPDLTFATVDTEAEQDLATAFDIRSIPTLMVFRDRVMVYGRPGALPFPVLDDLLRQVRELDMAEVRRQASEATV